MNPENAQASAQRLADLRGAPSASPPQIPDHELIRPIGRGSYGEVWLARSAMGTYRAVKIVYRRTFDEARPFERELSGLEKFEPISRSHPNLVAVLHVGRNEAAGCFYYVMELADDAIQERGGASAEVSEEVTPSSQSSHSPSSYRPRTLRSELGSFGRIPADRCVQIGLALTDALAHLHRNGLVHRDVKPSNIIFVQGVPKLADIGLVTDTQGTQSFVGTEGYLPAEGPGTPGADLYALGKVLYEISTGRDRKEFPELPTDLKRRPDHEALLELNEVVVKACQPEARRRYLSAEAMHADLALLAEGKSVVSVRARERRLMSFKRVAVAVLAVVIAGGALYLTARRSHRSDAEQAIRLDLSEGRKALDAGDSPGSLPWFADALRLAEADGQDPGIHRLRLAAIWRECPRFSRVFLHQGPVNAGVLSRDDRRLATASDDGTVRIWDLATGRMLTPPLLHQGEVRAVSFSPDGRQVVTGCEDGTARVWDAATGSPLTGPLRHGEAVTAVGFSPDGRRLLTASRDRTVRLFDALTGEPLAAPWECQSPVWYACFSPDGKRVLAASGEATFEKCTGQALIWDTDTGRAATFALRHAAPVLHAAFSLDGRRVATGSADGTARVWDADSGQPVTDPMRHQGIVGSVAFSGDGSRLATASGDQTARVWNAATGQAVTPPIRHGGPVRQTAFSPDDRLLVTVSGDQTARVWDAFTGEAVCPPLKHGSWVSSAAFSRDGRRIVTISGDHTARLWDLATSATSRALFTHPQPVQRAAFSHDGRKVVAASGDPEGGGEARLWDVATGQPGPSVRHDRLVWRVAFSPDDRRILTASHDQSLRVWEAQTGQPVTPPMRHPHPIWQARFSPDGKRVVAASGSENQPGEVRVWDAVTGQGVTPFLEHPYEVMGLDMSPDGRLLVTGCGSANGPGEARLWEATTGKPLEPSLRHTAPVWDCAFSPDGRRVVTASLDQTARLWDVATRQAIGQPLKHGGWVLRAVFSPDGRQVATASQDQTARLWRVPDGSPVTPPLAHGGAVTEVSFSPDGRLLITASTDHTARVWNATTGEPVTPPLRHDGTVTDVSFTPDGRQILTASHDRTVRLWELVGESRPAAELQLLAQLISGSRLRPEGGSVQLNAEELGAALETLRAKYPEDFVPSSERVTAWHERQVQDCERGGRRSPARFHLDRVMELLPEDAALRQERQPPGVGPENERVL